MSASMRIWRVRLLSGLTHDQVRAWRKLRLLYRLAPRLFPKASLCFPRAFRHYSLLMGMEATAMMLMAMTMLILLAVSFRIFWGIAILTWMQRSVISLIEG